MKLRRKALTWLQLFVVIAALAVMVLQPASASLAQGAVVLTGIG